MRFGWVQDNCKDWDPVPGIRNPLCGIQDPKLSWILFHGARECIHLMCIFKKRTSLGMHYCFEWSRGGGVDEKICRSCSHIYIFYPEFCGFSECSNHVDSEWHRKSADTPHSSWSWMRTWQVALFWTIIGWWVFLIAGIIIASHAGVFRVARFSSLPSNACSTEDKIPFPCLANHIVLSKFWKVDLDRKVIW